MDTNKMREQFEAWADSEGYVMDCVWGGDGNHGYEDEDTQYAWGLFQFAWQASRDAVLVELPPKISAHNTSEGAFVRPEAEHYDEAIDECRKAIEAQALKVAP